MLCYRCGQELANLQDPICQRCVATLIRFPPTSVGPPRTSARGAARQALIFAVAFGVLAVIALFIYFTRPGPCDTIFEQTAPKLAITLQHLKTNGGMVIGSDKVQDLAESSQRIGILCKTCCIAQQSGRIDAGQFQDCMNTTKSFETKVVEVATNVDAAISAKQQGQLQLVSEKTQQATLGVSAAAGDVQKAEKVAASSTTPTPASDASSGPESGIPAKAVVITKNDGTTMWVFEESATLALASLNSGNTDLGGGQSLDLGKVKAIDAHVDKDGKVTLRFTLLDGRTFETAGWDPQGYGVGGTNDIGGVNIPLKDVKQVVIPR
jgi:hypothetical protein